MEQNETRTPDTQQPEVTAAWMDAPAMEAKRPPITAAQKWLLPCTLALGIVLRIFWNNGGNLPYAIFWALALALYLAFAWREVVHDRAAIALTAATGTLLVLYAARPRLSAETDEWLLYLLDTVAIPCLLMLLPVYIQQRPEPQQEGALVAPYLLGWFVKPFSAIGRAFAVVGETGKGKGGVKPVLIGLAVGIPLMAAVTALLASADAAMERLVGGLLEACNIADVLWTIVLVVATALLFYSYFYNQLFGKARPHTRRAASWPAAAVCMVTGLLLLVYAVFTAVQFQYLFSDALPAEVTYSEYAREGFWQLIAAAVINFTVFALSLRYALPSFPLRIFQWGLLTATAVLLGSALWRLTMYISAYGWTMMRVLPLWMMVFLAALTVLCGVRLQRERLPLLRTGFFLLLYWFVALNLPDWAAILAA